MLPVVSVATMIRDPDMAYIIGALVSVLLAVAVVGIQGCTITHETPSAERAIKLAESWTACKKLDLPPIPQDVVIDIKGDKVTANQGGEQLLRGYVQCRSAYR